MNANDRFIRWTIWITFVSMALSFAAHKFMHVELLKFVGIGLGGAFANSIATYFVLKDFLKRDFDKTEIVPQRVE